MARNGDEFFGSNTDNSENLLSCFRSFGSEMEFLQNQDLHIPIFPTEVRCAAESVRYGYDFDGLVVQIKDVSCLRAGLQYLFCSKIDGHRLANHWHLLKKHLQLQEYSRDGLRALHRSYGHVVAHVDGGYFLNVSCITAEKRSPSVLYNSDIASKAQAVSLINQVLGKFQEHLSNLDPHDLHRPTVMKCNTLNPGYLNVLKQDQRFILKLFMSALNSVNVNESTKVIVTLTKFGQKDASPFDLGELIDPTGVESVSFHVACNVSGLDPFNDLLWSRVGLQHVVGARGSLFESCGMSEAANFQSNIDNLPMDLSNRLKMVFIQENCKLNFVQLYADSPHSHGTPLSKHPVSRIISTCGLHHPKHSSLLLSQAKGYIDLMQDLSKKTNCRIKARIEGVYYYNGSFPGYVLPEVFFSEPVLDTMLESTPLLITFKDDEFGYGLGEVLSGVSGQLSHRLRQLLTECKGTGGYIPSWTAFQYELALEQLFFGKPISPCSRQYSISLGVSGTHPDSISSSRRFLGLAPVGSASVGEDPPPPEIWIKDAVQIQRVRRLFPLTDALDAEAVVIGEKLVLVLLKDLFEKDVGLESLKGPKLHIGNVIDCRTVEEMGKELIQRKGFGYPHTFSRALEIISSRGHDVAECLLAGLGKIKFFPKIKYFDESRNVKAKWNGKDYVELLKGTETPSIETQIAVFTGDVISNIENRCLSFASNLRKYSEQGMPWMAACFERLPKSFPRERKLLILTYLSCVGLMQQHDFIAFDRLVELQKEMNLDLVDLQKLQLLSNLLLMNRPKVYRLPDTVPYKVIVTSALGKRAAPHSATPVQPQIQLVEEDPLVLEDELVDRVQSKTVPASEGAWWTSLELSIISTDKALTHKDAYQSYLATCKERNVRIRSFTAFRRKRQRIMH